MPKRSVFLFLFTLMLGFGISKAVAQTTVDVVLNDASPRNALARYRTPAVATNIATLAIHRTADFRNHASTTELRDRGFNTLGIRTRFQGSASVDWEQIAFDIQDGVRYLRAQGNTTIILIGHSGGGPSTSYYQAVVENGPSYCQGSNKLTECPYSGDEFTDDDRAQAIVFTDAHIANGANTLRSLNGSIMNETQPFGPAINKTLDPYLEENGFNPAGDSTYSDHFVRKYSRAQSRRMNGLIQDALRIRQEIELGVRDEDDDAFDFFRVDARLPEVDLDVEGGTLNPAKLLKDDGNIVGPQIVDTVRVPSPGNRESDLTSDQNLTITSFLSHRAIRSKHSLDDIDWCSSNNSVICAVRAISPDVPVLVMAMQGHYFIRDGENIYENSASADKDFVVVEGATHGLGNCTACAAFHGTGPYTNVPENLWNHVAEWINERF